MKFQSAIMSVGKAYKEFINNFINLNPEEKITLLSKASLGELQALEQYSKENPNFKVGLSKSHIKKIIKSQNSEIFQIVNT